LRRLRPSANVRFGEETALLLGDYLYARACEMIAGVGDAEITEWLARAAQETCEGEIAQIRNRFSAELSEEQYFTFIRKKTAVLMSACARSGAKLAGLSEGDREALSSFGLSLGISFQIIDDLLDIVGTERSMGKTLRTDAGNGKMTLPMIILMQEMNPEEKNVFLANFLSGRLDWEAVRALLEKYGILRRTENIAEGYFLQAVRRIGHFDLSVQEPLTNLFRFVLKRDR
jgi:octaprenyl-diphosphate synthase